MLHAMLLAAVMMADGGDLREQLAAARDRAATLERKLASANKTLDALRAENARLTKELEDCRSGGTGGEMGDFGQRPTPLTPANLIRAMSTPDQAKRALFAARAVGQTIRWSGEVVAADGDAASPLHVAIYCDDVLVELRLAGKGACETPVVGRDLHFVGEVSGVSGDATYGVVLAVQNGVAAHDAAKVYPLERKFRR